MNRENSERGRNIERERDNIRVADKWERVEKIVCVRERERERVRVRDNIRVEDKDEWIEKIQRERHNMRAEDKKNE